MSELEKTVADILVKATNAAEAAGKFAMEQLPDIAQQYVLFKGGWALLESALIVATLVALFFIWRWFIATMKKNDAYKGDFDVPAMFVTLIGGLATVAWVLVAIVSLFNNAQTAFLAFFAPKILLIQWAATLAK
jgi:hypothetical protein